MPRTFLENRKIKEQRTQEILAVSLKLFSTKGYENVTIDEIADAVKCSHGLFYHYFAGKKEILAELNKRCQTFFSDCILDLTHIEEPGFNFIKEFTNFFFDYIYKSPENNYYGNLFLTTKLSELNKNPDGNLFEGKIQQIINKSIKGLKKDAYNFSSKEIDEILKFYLLFLYTYTTTLIKYPKLVKEKPKMDTIYKFINQGIRGNL